MILTEDQIDRIETGIKSRGILIGDLLESMIDHVCCQIENSADQNFDEAFAKAMKDFGGDEMTHVQTDIRLYDQFRKVKRSKKWMYSLGFLAAFLASTGILFKQMHWPSANICLVLGVFILNFGFLPLYFYERYRESVKVN